jgi:hypothetical protein
MMQVFLYLQRMLLNHYLRDHYHFHYQEVLLLQHLHHLQLL